MLFVIKTLKLFLFNSYLAKTKEVNLKNMNPKNADIGESFDNLVIFS